MDDEYYQSWLNPKKFNVEEYQKEIQELKQRFLVKYNKNYIEETVHDHNKDIMNVGRLQFFENNPSNNVFAVLTIYIDPKWTLYYNPSKMEKHSSHTNSSVMWSYKTLTTELSPIWKTLTKKIPKAFFNTIPRGFDDLYVSDHFDNDHIDNDGYDNDRHDNDYIDNDKLCPYTGYYRDGNGEQQFMV
jgi:hypothetical protein